MCSLGSSGYKVGAQAVRPVCTESDPAVKGAGTVAVDPANPSQRDGKRGAGVQTVTQADESNLTGASPATAWFDDDVPLVGPAGAGP
jgi:hypothetical protein